MNTNMKSNVQSCSGRRSLFGNRVLRSIDGLLDRDALERCIHDWYAMGRADPENEEEISCCAERVQQLTQIALEERTPQNAPPYPSETVLTSRVLEAHLKSEVQEVRQKLFGQIDPPHATPAESARWIKDRAAASGQPTRQRRNRTTMSFYDPESESRISIFVVKGSDLETLHVFTERVGGEASLSQAVVIAHVLAGLPLVRSRLAVKVSHKVGGLPRPTEVTITLYAANPTQQDFLTAYQLVRQYRPTAPNPVSEQDLQLFEAVLAAGPPVRGETAEWWERVRKAANRNLKRSQAIASADAARVRWQRLRNRKLPQGMIPAHLTKPLKEPVQGPA
jgi:hypothetical protein